MPEQGAVREAAPPALAKGGQGGQECPFVKQFSLKKLNQIMFLSTLLLSKYYNTFEFGEVYLTVLT